MYEHIYQYDKMIILVTDSGLCRWTFRTTEESQKLVEMLVLF